MVERRKAIYITTILLILGGIIAAVISVAARRYNLRRTIILKGAVVKQDVDPMKESPITDVDISEANDLAAGSTKTNFNGYFSFRLRRGIGVNRSVTIKFRHPDYEPQDLTELASDRLIVVHLVPLHNERQVASDRPAITVANVRIRYTTEATTQDNIGTGVKTFQIQNVGDIPCNNQAPCSPDHRWKAAITTESMDAGEGSFFRNARVSCIAGPCPFTRIDVDGFSRGGRYINVTARNWSDTVTFLLQAEVFRPQISDIVRMTYPIILGTSLNFTLPPSADGPSVEAELNGENIVFPLGPAPVLSWADCNVSVAKNQTRFYRCELNAGYRFR